MKRNEVIQIRIEPQLRARLNRLRDERNINVSAWLRRIISDALDRDFPPPTTGPAADGWLRLWTSRLRYLTPSWWRFSKESS